MDRKYGKKDLLLYILEFIAVMAVLLGCLYFINQATEQRSMALGQTVEESIVWENDAEKEIISKASNEQ